MRNPFIALLVSLVMIIGLQTGCAPGYEEHQGAATGAVIGGATGAMAGAVLAGEGSRAQGAIIGGLAGALVGSVIGSYSVDRQGGSDGTFDHDGGSSSATTRVRIKEVSVSPAKAYPGDRIDLRATYTIKASRGNPRVAITETREIYFKGDLVGKPEVDVTHTPGTYDSDVPLFLSRTARPGTYKVVTTVMTADGSDSKETSFTVR